MLNYISFEFAEPNFAAVGKYHAEDVYILLHLNFLGENT